MAGITHPAAAKEAYDSLLSRVSELEIDLSRTSSALKHSTESNDRLRSLHDDLQSMYDRDRKYLDTLREELNAERASHAVQEKEFQDQMQMWHQDLESKAKELEELQEIQPQKEIERIKIKVIEEFEEPYEQKLRVLNSKMQVEQRKAGDARRQLEMEKLERQEEVKEIKSILQETKDNMKTQTEILTKQIRALESENKKQLDISASTNVLRQQLQEYQTKNKYFQNEIEELMSGHKAEVDELAKQILNYSKESQKDKKEKRMEEVEREQLRRQLEEQMRQFSAEREQHQTVATEVASLRLRIQELLAAPSPVQDSERVNDLKQQINELDKQLAVKTQEVTMLQDRLSLQTSNFEKEKESKQAQQQARETVSTKSTAGSAAVNLTTNRLRDEVERLRASIMEKEEAIKRVNNEWEREVEMAREENVKLHVEVKSIAAAKKEQEELLRIAREELAARDRCAATIETELDESQRKQKSLEHRLEEAENDRKSMEEKIVSCKHELGKSQTRVEEMEKNKHESLQCAAMAKETLEEQKKTHAKELKEQTAKLIKMKKLNKELRQKMLQIVQKMNQLQEEKQSLMNVCEENRHKYELYMAEARSSLQFNTLSDAPGATGPLQLERVMQEQKV